MKKRSVSIFFVVSVFFSFVSLFSFAEADTRFLDSASSELIYEKKATDSEQTKKETKKFNSTVGFQQINGFIISADHISQLFLSGLYRFAEKWSVSFSQTVNRHYFLNPNSNDKGLWIQDTALSVNGKFTNLPYKNRLTVTLSSTLPLSHYSQTNDILTVSTAYLNWSLKLDPLLGLQLKWIKDINVFVKPVARYYSSVYTTSRTEGQSVGGSPLPEFLFGLQNVGLSFNITDYFSVSGGYGRWIIFPYKTTTYKKDKLGSYDDHYQRHYYLFSFAGSVKIKKQWTASLSYSLIDRLDKQGHLETVLFDDRLSTWAVSVSYSLSFNSI